MPGGRHDNDSGDISKINIIPTHQEIMSDASECLPSTNLLQPHFLSDPAQRHIDSAFRLLRHDIFGSVKDVLRGLLASDNLRVQPTETRDLGAHIYLGAHIIHMYVDERAGLQAILAFQVPAHLRKKSLKEQRRWWNESSRLGEGLLVALVVGDGTTKSLLFVEISARNVDEKKKTDQRLTSCLVSEHGPCVTVKLAACLPSDLTLLTRIHGERLSGVLVEFHSLIPATFTPILQSLQRMAGTGDIAFRPWIVPSSPPNLKSRVGKVPPAAYARKPGFTFCLNSITKEPNGDLVLNPSESPSATTLGNIAASTGLDHGQCRGLVNALTQEYCMIQGPPGTGKSYLGVQLVRVLLDNKKKAQLGPIIVICYTNHALDQFLTHLLEVGIRRIIRIGGRSQATELEGKNLRIVSQNTSKTRVESQILGKSYGGQETCLQSAGNSLKPLHQSRNGPTWSGLAPYLRMKHHEIHGQLDQESEEGFTMVGGDPLTNWLGSGASKKRRNVPQLQDVAERDLRWLQMRAEADINQLTEAERWVLAQSWLAAMRADKTAELFEALEEAERHRQSINGVHDDVNRRTLLQADVVGLTTTSLARMNATIGHLRPKVIICEEAAEVMEAHILSALLPGVQHFIQIGDHRQLRPQILNHSLSLETPSGRTWQLDRSQFERRAVGEPGFAALPVSQLTVQRRMRPEISRLIRSVYPKLEDHDMVQTLPDVVGMRHNLFWLDHHHAEDSSNDGIRVKSHSNRWEVDMATALVRHIVRQGEYKSADIALLTPYAGQLQKLRSSLSKDFEVFLSERDVETLADQDLADGEDVLDNTSENDNKKQIEKRTLVETLRLATVDNFQGEEAKVIIVSLVRSNQARKVGFLRTENRINVLLSRAKHGLYLIGNAQTYQNVKMWSDVHSQLSEADAVGESLQLCCPRHPDKPIHCSEPDDFLRHSPEGGCDLACGLRLDPCGHRCTAKCHSQFMHEAFSCPQPCPRIRATCDHVCPKTCGQRCGDCMVLVRDVRLPCGHITALRCHQTLALSEIRCSVMVDKTVPGCAHVVRVLCSEDVSLESFRCATPCNTSLGCGHLCKTGACGVCRQKEEAGVVVFKHPKCKTRCDRPRSGCNHRCSRACHQGEDCGDCVAPCEVRCPHSSCALVCSKACALCIEICAWNCEHQGSCTMPCAAPCNRLPCNERCSKTLRCGHRCPSFCGEVCPHELCQICGTKGDARVDLLEFKPYSEINVDESPIVLLGCGHFFTGETLDGMVGMSDVYTLDKAGEFNGLLETPGHLAVSIPSCPDCQRPIRQFVTRRYNRVINRAVLDETSKRFLLKGRRELDALKRALETLEANLEKDRPTVWVTGENFKRRYEESNALQKRADLLRASTTEEHHPIKRLQDAIRTARQRQESSISTSLERQMDNLTVDSQEEATTTPAPSNSKLPGLDSQVTLGAQLIRIKVQAVVLRDKLALLRTMPNIGSFAGGMPHKAAVPFLAEARKFIVRAKHDNLIRLAVDAILAFALVAQLTMWSQRPDTEAAPGQAQGQDKSVSNTPSPESVRMLLKEGMDLCSKLADATELRDAIEKTMRLSEGITPEELAAIKSAMLKGRGGIATHSGHWYNCVNGHPFAIGECGMPMELARCPDCGEPIGGQSHQPAVGVTRAMNIERA